MTQANMVRAVVRSCKANKVMNGYVRLVVTRGVGTLGLNPYLCAKPQVIIIAANIQLYPRKLYTTGLELVTVGTIRNNPESVNPNIKSLNYLNNILAKIEAINSGCVEGLMLNGQGFVAEGSGDNIFALKGNRLMTPSRSEGILVGITRNAVMTLAEQQEFDVCEERMTRHDLYNADECFLTGTAAEIVPVISLDGHEIGSGKPGKLTHELLAAYRELRVQVGAKVKYKTEAATS